MRMTWAPVTSSPAITARWIGAAPRQRGSREACRLNDPSRGAVEHGARQDLAEGDHHGGVEVERLEGRDLVGVAHGRGRAHRQPEGLGEGLDRRGPHLLAPAARFLRLAVDRRDLVAGRGQLGQRPDGEIGRSQEGDAHAAEALAARIGRVEAGEGTAWRLHR